MAKIPKFKANLVGKNRLKPAKVKGPVTGHIAYKINAKDLSALTESKLDSNAHTAYEAGKAIDIQNAKLIGLQIDFKEPDKFCDYAKFSQIYYLPNEDDYYKLDLTLFHQNSTSNEIVCLRDDYLYDIQRNPKLQLTRKNEFELVKGGNSQKSWNFQKFEFFDDQPDNFEDKVDFVYFSIEELDRFLELYLEPEGAIVISGCQINYGKQLTAGLSGEKVNSKKDSKYFSLKMEGELIQSNTTSKVQKTEPINGLNENMVDGPDIIIGIPCPPKWYILRSLLTATKKINPKTRAVLGYKENTNITFKTLSLKEEYQQNIQD